MNKSYCFVESNSYKLNVTQAFMLKASQHLYSSDSSERVRKSNEKLFFSLIFGHYGFSWKYL
jgi:hypothetical protein